MSSFGQSNGNDKSKKSRSVCGKGYGIESAGDTS